MAPRLPPSGSTPPESIFVTTDLKQQQRRQGLQATGPGSAHAAVEGTLLLLFAWLGEIDWTFPLWFMSFSLVVQGLFAVLIASGWTQGLRDPALPQWQIIFACATKVAILLSAPQLAIVLLIGVCASYNFALLSLHPRRLSATWVLAGVVVSASLYAVRDRLRFPHMDGSGAFAIWFYLLLCLQMAVVGARFSTLRSKLSQRDEQLSASLGQLRELSMQEHVQQRLAARERLARELHDALLQGMQGLVLRLQSVAQGVPAELPARTLLEQALEQADQLVLDGRDRLGGIRLACRRGADLADALWAAGEDLSADHRARFRLVADGSPRKLHAAMEEQSYLIGRDALIAAYQHPGVAEVEIELAFRAESLLMKVCHTVAAAPADKAYAALVRELRARADALGGHIDWRASTARNELAFTLPAHLAYAHAQGADECADQEPGQAALLVANAPSP